METISGSSQGHRWSKLIHGTLFIFLAEVLIFPASILTIAVLTRKLGPSSYGLWILCATFVAWIEWSLTSAFARATVKAVAEADEQKSAGAAIVRLHLAVGLAGAGLLYLLADAVANILHAPEMAGYLRLFALDIPLFSMARGYRSILVGMGQYRKRAYCSAAYISGELLLMILLVGSGFSLQGAVWANIGGSLIELAVCHFFCVPTLLFHNARFSYRKLLSDSAPLFMTALCMRFYGKIGIFVLKMLGATTAQAGFYGSAQGLAEGMGVFAISVSPVLISSITTALKNKDQNFAAQMTAQALRFGILLLPFAAVGAASTLEIVHLIFGPEFSAAAPLLTIFTFNALALILIALSTAIFTAYGKLLWTFALTGPLIPLVVAGYLILIPAGGSTAAALVTTCVTSLGAAAAMITICKQWRVSLPLKTFFRSALTALCLYPLAVIWPASGLFLFLKLFILSFAALGALMLMGEITQKEWKFLRSLYFRSEPLPVEILQAKQS